MPSPLQHLSRRERQIMDVVYAAGRATASDVQERIADAPSYSAVRALLKVLEQKGHLHHELDGTRHVFLPTLPASRARAGALKNLVATFFQGSTTQAVAALLDLDKDQMSDVELERISQLIDLARKEGR